MVFTDLGILEPDPESGELTLVALHPGASVEEAREATGWDLKVTENPKTTEPSREGVLRDLKERTARARKEKVG